MILKTVNLSFTITISKILVFKFNLAGKTLYIKKINSGNGVNTGISIP